jgi:hypothetical protein
VVTPNEPVLLERYGPLIDAELRRIGVSEALLGFDYETTKGNLFERSDGRSSTNRDFHVSRWRP